MNDPTDKVARLEAKLERALERLEHTSPFARVGAVMACDQVPARVFVAVGRGAMGAHKGNLEARSLKPRREVVTDLSVVQARRVQGGDANQILRQGDQCRLLRDDPGTEWGQGFVWHVPTMQPQKGGRKPCQFFLWVPICNGLRAGPVAIVPVVSG